MGLEIDPMQDILITVGAYEALFCAIQALISEGDEISSVKQYLSILGFNLIINYLIQKNLSDFILN